ncbi:MAG: thiamine biosynthesis protein ThiF [Novosphingobium sp. 28-62-57]|uniref:ThiF family adenylyltransferase n=1 Tax=unclassified Novosphingobium TaxID=2644732 RepID=UPI000BD7CC3C|nr:MULTISPECIES: ThiF family adenylyltransferase [unclassified Novosphingobium]OYW50988.1 MAG: thiamine biosynthesis protein ThiF [Novosphingobium sp. 12-62-10]OYZ11190.1 MAG: thiamine biosynthesis protein ThiF [Novosphingobium sp. 28-62-57]OZA36247.1 MAG: thiamine biosynthesis protein ThiF [Novosphingobium sp. 17-62-9]
MTNGYELALPGLTYDALLAHLLAHDGNEGAAILLCRDAAPVRSRLMVVEAILVPHDACAIRRPDYISWPGELLSAAIDRAEDDGLSIILLHSHPGGFPCFSRTDDVSDRTTIGSIFEGWSGSAPAAGHGSAIMIAPGIIRARLYQPDLQPRDVARVIVAGDDIRIWDDGGTPTSAMAFGSDMTRTLSTLHACVIGVSGTGSIIAEQAARMGFGALTLIDFDHVEAKNLNRILYSTTDDAARAAPKVEMFAAALARVRPTLQVTQICENIFQRDAAIAAAQADVLFSCVDSSEGRQIADLIAQAFMIPLIDMGVTIPTRRLVDGTLAIIEVMGRIDYVQPGGSTLGDRAVYTPASLRAEYLARTDPERFAAEQREGYIKGAPEEAPSVIALNMRAASAAMLECVARLFPFRHDGNSRYARTLFALADGDEEAFSEAAFERAPNPLLGRGALEPLLGLPALG